MTVVVGKTNRALNPSNPKHPANKAPVGQGGAKIEVISGTNTTGGVLSVTNPGYWSAYPRPTYTYAWYRGATFTSITTQNYTILVGDIGQTMTCRITATNVAGSSASPNISNGISIV
jgi:hypothetical protein